MCLCVLELIGFVRIGYTVLWDISKCLERKSVCCSMYLCLCKASSYTSFAHVFNIDGWLYRLVRTPSITLCKHTHTHWLPSTPVFILLPPSFSIISCPPTHGTLKQPSFEFWPGGPCKGRDNSRDLSFPACSNICVWCLHCINCSPVVTCKVKRYAKAECYNCQFVNSILIPVTNYGNKETWDSSFVSSHQAVLRIYL